MGARMAVPSAQSSNTGSASADVDLQASGPRAMFGLDAGIRNLTRECMKQYGYQLHNGKFALILHVRLKIRGPLRYSLFSLLPLRSRQRQRARVYPCRDPERRGEHSRFRAMVFPGWEAR
jgi:hypothetical protein